MRSLGDSVDLVIDGGSCESGIESTVVDVRGPSARVLRLGALSVETLRRVEPGILVQASTVELAGRTEVAVPGMDPRHYAPRARLTVAPDAVSVWQCVANDPTAGGIVRTGVEPFASSLAATRVRILPADPAPFAASLYAALHDLDALGLAHVLVEAPPEGDPWDAIRDRLHRAST